jgi:hypothetical protein
MGKVSYIKHKSEDLLGKISVKSSRLIHIF